MQLMSVFSCPFPIVFCLFYHPLQRCLALSSSIYKDNMFLSLQLFQLFMQTAHVIAVNRRLMDNTKTERFFCPGYKCEKFLHQLCLVLGTGFFPDKGILVSVQKEKLPGYGAYPGQHVHHPSQYYFKAARCKERNRAMVAWSGPCFPSSKYIKFRSLRQASSIFWELKMPFMAAYTTIANNCRRLT